MCGGGTMKNSNENKMVFNPQNKNGTVLVLVLILLVGAIMIAVATHQQSIIGIRIAGNDKQFTQDYYEVEGGLEALEQNLAAVITTLGENASLIHTLDDDAYAAHLGENVVKTKIVKIAGPPKGQGMSADMFKARYYLVNATQEGQEVDAGLWKAFPREDAVVIGE